MSEVEQVGGTHYNSEYQHWDWVEDNGIGYLEGCATKYLVRWRSKDGLKDLKKARSYVKKLIARAQEGNRHNRSYMTIQSFVEFCHKNHIKDPLEVAGCLLLGSWDTAENLLGVMGIITELITQNFPESLQSTISTDQPFAMGMPF